MDPNKKNSFMNLLTGDESQQQSKSNAPNHPPNWQYSQYSATTHDTTKLPISSCSILPTTSKHPKLYIWSDAPTLPSQQQNPTPLSTPSPQPENDPKNNEGGDNASKWTLVEDRWLVKLWINVSTNPLTGANQKKSDFCTKVAHAFNQAAPSGAAKKPPTTINSRWNRAAPLVSKWCGCVVEAYQEKPSGANEDDIFQNAHNLYEIKMGKKFTLMH